MSAPWQRFLVLGMAAHLVTAAAGEDLAGLGHQLIGWATVVAILLAARRFEPRSRSPWRLIAAGAGLLLAGGIAQEIHASVAGVVEPFPSWGDPAYITGYLVVFAGEHRLVRLRTIVRQRQYVLDALIFTAAIGLLAWATILSPYARDASIELGSRLINIQYSFLTLMLIAVTARLAVGPGLRAPSYYLLAAGIANLFVADTLITLQTTGNLETDLPAFVVPFSYVFVGAAALHPSAESLTSMPDYREPRLTWRRIAMLAGALLMAPAVLSIQMIQGEGVDLPVVVAGSVILSLVVLLRLASLVREEEANSMRERALRDVGSELVAGTSRDEMTSAALRGVIQLTRGLRSARASVLFADGDELEVVAAIGEHSRGSLGLRFRESDLPSAVREALTQRSAISLEEIPAFDVHPSLASGREASVVVAPLVARDETRGAITVSSAVPLQPSIVRALWNLATEVSLAIDSAELTEDLHRRRSDRRFRSLVENSSEMILVLDDEGRSLFASPVAERLLGRPEDDFLGELPETLVHPQDSAKLGTQLRAARGRATDDEPNELRVLHGDGTYRWFEVRARDLSSDPEIGGLVLTARDITDRKAAEQRLARSEARFRALVQNSSDILAVVDERAFFTYVSPAVSAVLGYRPEELVGTNVMRLLPSEEVSRAMRLFGALSGRVFNQLAVETRMRDLHGIWHNLDVTISDLRAEPAVQGIVLNARDVTVRRALELDIERRSSHDELTGLLNRAVFEDRLKRALARSEPRLDQVSVLFVDVDDFKEVNDSLGYTAGDQLLLAVAERIRACLRVSDTAARLGGDDFAILLEDTYGESEVRSIAERLLTSIAEPYRVEGRELAITASIGIAVDPERKLASEALMRAADVAVFVAKQRGKGRFEVFEEEQHAGAFDRLEMKAALGRAVAQHEMVLHYQPIVELDTGRVVGCEALARWNHPERGLLPPSQFIGLAEESGLIVGIGKWVLEESCRQLSAWTDQHPHLGDLHMSVNLSVRQVESPTLLEDVAEALRLADLDAKRLTLEITESLLMADGNEIRERLNELRSRGISLAIDDFGTGYSSLGFIQQFPVDVVKVDRTFVERLGARSGTNGVVRTVVEMAHGLRASVVAEGIEEPEQVRILTEIGCGFGQGYYFSRPVTADAFAELAARSQPPALGEPSANPVELRNGVPRR